MNYAAPSGTQAGTSCGNLLRWGSGLIGSISSWRGDLSQVALPADPAYSAWRMRLEAPRVAS